ARAKYNNARLEGNTDRYYGLTFWSPNVNIFRDPRWGRGQETYGEDPYLTSRLAVEFIRNLQNNGAPHMMAAACAKHFAVHSGPELLRHVFDAPADPKDMNETYLPAFEACVKEGGVEAVMGAYNKVGGVPCCCNEKLIKDTLRQKWGFRGHVVSDCGAICNIYETHRYAESLPEAAALALKAGCDLNCGDAYEKLVDAYEQDMVGDADLDRALERLLATRFKLGILPGQTTEYDGIGMDVVACPEHVALAFEAAVRSLVLLKNDGILPIRTAPAGEDRSPVRLAVIGPNADSLAVLLGNYNGDPVDYYTPLAGLTERAGDGLEVEYAAGCELFTATEESIALACAVAKRADAVILCLGTDARYEGEEADPGAEIPCGDRESIALPEAQLKLFDAICETNPNVVTLSFSGSAWAYGRVARKSRALLHCWYPGEQGGRAIAAVLLGDRSPVGRLPVTFYASEAQLPPFEDYSMKGRTYKYFEGEPAYPFGFGLCYSEVSHTPVEISCSSSGATVCTTVKNEGEHEILGGTVLVFAVPKSRASGQPIKILVDFRKIDLAPGESRSLVFTVPDEKLCYFASDGEKILPGSEKFFFEIVV
ncbi:MAG: glycoside hydrolase family 3 C-terminal domain-containing protein, partial [Clostridia bacterium]|nr:glycoside hydrolase family 3 C-terminal domain-containing protein [Clostridia bacterium]